MGHGEWMGRRDKLQLDTLSRVLNFSVLMILTYRIIPFIVKHLSEYVVLANTINCRVKNVNNNVNFENATAIINRPGVAGAVL